MKEPKGVFHYVFWGVVSLIATGVILAVLALFLFVGVGVVGHAAKQARIDRLNAEDAAAKDTVKDTAPAEPTEEEKKLMRMQQAETNRLAEDLRDQAENKKLEEEALKRQIAEKQKRLQDSKVKTFQFYLGQAKNGDGYAQLRIGKLYLAGEGVEKDQTEARKWLTAASTNGQPEAIKLLTTANQ